MISVKANAIGVDISTSSVKVAKVVKSTKKLTLKAYAEEKIPISALVAGVIRQPENVEKALEACLEKIGIKPGEKVYAVATIPDDKTYMQEGIFPNIPFDKLKEAIQFKIQSYIPLPITEVYWDFAILEENDDNTLRLVIAAASKETVDSYYAVLKKVGLIPIAFESSSVAALRLLQEKITTSSIILDFGKAQTSISLAEKNIVKYTSTVHTGLNQLIKVYDEFFHIDDDKSAQLLKENGLDAQNQELQQQLDMVLASLKQDLTQTLHYQSTNTIHDIYLFGDGTYIKGLQQLFHVEDGITFHDITVDIQNPFPKSILEILPVVGATSKSYIHSDEKEINFLPYAAQKEITKNIIIEKILLFLRLAAINMFCYAAVFIIFIFFLSVQQQYVKERQTSITNDIAKKNYPAINQTIGTENANLLKLQTAENGFVNWIPFLTEVSQLVPQGITLNSYNINPSNPGWAIAISGTASNRDVLLSYLNNLEYQSHYLSQVALPITYIQDNNTITFSLTAKLTTLK